MYVSSLLAEMIIVVATQSLGDCKGNTAPTSIDAVYSSLERLATQP